MAIIINTWVFVDDIKKGKRQNDLFRSVKSIGADGIEVRREYFTDLKKEIIDISVERKEQNLLVNYSVPDEVFETDGSINPKLNQYFDEADKMGISKIKFNLGNYNNYEGNLLKDFSKYPIDKIKMNVENDQTKVSGNVKKIKEFLKDAKQVNLPIGFVFDLGNLAFTHQNPDETAKELYSFVDYLHLKNTLKNNDILETSDSLENGLFDWKKVVKELPNNIDYALEFPMKNGIQIKKQFDLLKKEVK